MHCMIPYGSQWQSLFILKTLTMRNYTMALCLIFIISSCTTLYIPSRINVPELQKKGDLRASAAVGLGGFNFQWAWASGWACGQYVGEKRVLL